MAQMVLQAIEQAGTNFVQSAAVVLPRAVTMISILLVGWFIAIVLKRLTRWALSRFGFNRLMERLGVAASLKTADLPTADVVASRILFWIVWIGFLVSGVDVLGFVALQGVVTAFALFVPRLLVAIAILVVGFVIANFTWRATLLAAVNSGIPSPRVLSAAVRALVLVLAAAMALDQIALARTIVLTAFTISFGAVMLGLAIAFGVGGSSVARRILDHWFPEQARSKADELRHL